MDSRAENQGPAGGRGSIGLPDLRRLVLTDPAAARAAITAMVGAELDYSTAMQVAKVVERLGARDAKPLRLAILGGFTTTQLALLLRLFLSALGIDCVIYEADFDVFRQEILDPESGLHAFGPDLVYLATHRRNLGRLPRPDHSPAQVEEMIASEVEAMAGLWETAHARLRCRIIQNNVDAPAWRVLANHDARHHAGLARYVARLNLALADRAPSYVAIHDSDHLAAAAGRWAWGDPRFHFQAKLPCAPEFLVPYAHSVASVAAAMVGKARKCLVLDLDNTLWGGVVGDDGIGGIRLGHGDAEGEAFLEFQQYVDGLRRRGVILAVCSKNEHQTAMDAVANHPDMIVRPEHIACFMANWDDKASNLRRIAQTLDIALDALVFVDDNPAERDLVRRLAPEVAVPELPEDPAGYIQAIERQAYFQVLAVGVEDMQRSDMYQANAARRKAEESAGDLAGFLASLDMVAKVAPVTDANAERVAQLLARSNQFNLTTRRHSAAAVLDLARDADAITLTVSLRDRFGDNGLISVLLARCDGDAAMIDTWIMSCRVLKRGVEQFLLNTLCAAVRSRGVAVIRGEYIPTPKNNLVRDHFARLGFAADGGEADGRTCWRLDLDRFRPLPTCISEEPA